MQPITDDQRQKVQAWFDEKAPLIGACPMCKQRQWVLGDYLVQPMPFTEGGTLVIGGLSMPLLMLICGNCGNVQFQSAVMAGLVSHESGPQSDANNG